MIKNEKQYKITRGLLKKFQLGLTKLAKLPESKEQPWLRGAQRNSILNQMAQWEEEISEYEALKSGKMKVALPSVDAIGELPILLIKKRIANGWTQKQLADKLDMHAQQLQQYEHTNYQSASLATIHRVAEALMESTKTRTTKRPASRSRSAAKVATNSRSKTSAKSSASTRRKAAR